MRDEQGLTWATSSWMPSVYFLPVAPYVGLPLEQAAALAASEGCELTDRTGQSLRTLELRPHRVDVELDDGA